MQCVRPTVSFCGGAKYKEAFLARSSTDSPVTPLRVTHNQYFALDQAHNTLRRNVIWWKIRFLVAAGRKLAVQRVVASAFIFVVEWKRDDGGEADRCMLQMIMELIRHMMRCEQRIIIFCF